MSNNDTIHLEFELPFAPEKVWRALTDPVVVAKWLMPAKDIKAEVGHRFTFQGPKMDDWDGTIDCVMLEVRAPQLLRYSWKGGPSSSRLNSEVLWTLEPRNGGTLLRLAQSGFSPANAFAFDIMGKGWRSMGDRFRAALADV